MLHAPPSIRARIFNCSPVSKGINDYREKKEQNEIKKQRKIEW